MLPNPALEPTRNGWSLQAHISFWAFRAHPLLAAQLQRWASNATRCRGERSSQKIHKKFYAWIKVALKSALNLLASSRSRRTPRSAWVIGYAKNLAPLGKGLLSGGTARN